MQESISFLHKFLYIQAFQYKNNALFLWYSFQCTKFLFVLCAACDPKHKSDTYWANYLCLHCYNVRKCLFLPQVFSHKNSQSYSRSHVTHHPHYRENGGESACFGHVCLSWSLTERAPKRPNFRIRLSRLNVVECYFILLVINLLFYITILLYCGYLST